MKPFSFHVCPGSDSNRQATDFESARFTNYLTGAWVVRLAEHRECLPPLNFSIALSAANFSTVDKEVRVVFFTAGHTESLLHREQTHCGLSWDEFNIASILDEVLSPGIRLLKALLGVAPDQNSLFITETSLSHPVLLQLPVSLDHHHLPNSRYSSSKNHVTEEGIEPS